MILRVAHLSDSHFDERRRLDDTVAVHETFVVQARAAGVHLIVHAGDVYERKSTPAERNAVARFLIQAADVAPVVIVRGNHDAPGDLDILRELGSENEIFVHDRPQADPLRVREFVVLPLPWFDKSHLVSCLDADVPAAETTRLVVGLAQQLLATLRTQATNAAAQGFVPIIVGHPLVAGAETSTGQTLIGQTVELSPHDLHDVGAAYCALGHIHKPQEWYDGRVGYAGSPEPHNFGEDHAHGWKLITIDTERWREPGGVTVEFRELPGRTIRLIEVDWTTEPGLGMPSPAFTAGSLVRIRYRVRPEDLHLIDEERLRQTFAGAHDIKLEPVLVHETRARVPEIASARDTWSKVQAYWTAKAIAVDEATAERCRARLAEIEQPSVGATSGQEADHAAA